MNLIVKISQELFFQPNNSNSKVTIIEKEKENLFARLIIIINTNSINLFTKIYRPRIFPHSRHVKDRRNEKKSNVPAVSTARSSLENRANSKNFYASIETFLNIKPRCQDFSLVRTKIQKRAMHSRHVFIGGTGSLPRTRSLDPYFSPREKPRAPRVTLPSSTKTSKSASRGNPLGNRVDQVWIVWIAT